MFRLKIEEETLNHDIWGSSVDLEVEDEAEELGILEVLEKHLIRPAKVFHDDKELPESALERAKGLRQKGVKGKKRSEKKRRRR